MLARAARLVLPAVWLGLIIGISLIEAPLKFQAPGAFTSWAPLRRRACHSRISQPEGSSSVAPRPPGPASAGGATTVAPSPTARSTAASVSSTAT